MISSRRQVLVGSLILAVAWVPGSVFAAEANSKPVIEAMGKVRAARTDVVAELQALTAKEGKVVMQSDLAPLSAALDGLVGSRNHFVAAWRKWSKGKHVDVDEKLTLLASNLTHYKAAMASIPARGILTPAMVAELRVHDEAVATLTQQIGDRVDQLCVAH